MDSSTRAFRRKSRMMELINKVAEIDQKIPQQSNEETLASLCLVSKQSNEIIAEDEVKDRTEHTSEVVMDAQLQKMSHEVMTKVLLQNSDFNAHMYQTAILGLVRINDEMNWSILGNIACQLNATVLSKSSMLGIFHPESVPKEAKQRQTRRPTELAEEKMPTTVDKLQRDDTGAQKVVILQKLIVDLFKANNRQPIPYYQLIIDPGDFMQTVENAFQMAFLVRDNYIAIETGQDNYPQVRPTTSEERSTKKEANQWISSLDMALCKEMAEFYGIRKPLLEWPPVPSNEK